MFLLENLKRELKYKIANITNIKVLGGLICCIIINL
ncbi:hypothetical protein BDCR2A_01485 [Borrelia duttonii CR2A]|uniref:Uncharacterized protein n=1 Tax=Borrelia duttonii CR2A TaxID=1432657 RepID=W6TK54_9SPIR|nr:hypothetical protein BDCR2A_01485 [Borrelia duttonii CR2A]